MNTANLALVSIRLLAIYCLIEAFQCFAFYAPIEFITSQTKILSLTQNEAWWLSLIPGGSILLLALLLFVFSKSLAHRLVPSAADAREILCSFDELQAILFAMTGIVILVLILPAFAHELQRWAVYYHSDESQRSGKAIPSLFNLMAVLVQMAAGLGLLLNPRGFKNIWRFLRTAGT